MRFCNIDFKLLYCKDIFKIEKDQLLPKFIVTVNAAMIGIANTNKHFMDICNTYYSTFDGLIPLQTAKIINKVWSIEKISGSDLGYMFCEYAKKNNLKMYLLGGSLDSNKCAVENIKRKYGIKVDGYSPVYEQDPYSASWNAECLCHIAAFKPDILFVGLGAPKQEFFIDNNFTYLNRLGCIYVIGCGGTIDFMANKVKRAPVFIQKLGFEWLYRFLQEPTKMRFKRIIDSFKIFKYIISQSDFK